MVPNNFVSPLSQLHYFCVVEDVELQSLVHREYRYVDSMELLWSVMAADGNHPINHIVNEKQKWERIPTSFMLIFISLHHATLTIFPGLQDTTPQHQMSHPLCCLIPHLWCSIEQTERRLVYDTYNPSLSFCHVITQPQVISLHPFLCMTCCHKPPHKNQRMAALFRGTLSTARTLSAEKRARRSLLWC